MKSVLQQLIVDIQLAQSMKCATLIFLSIKFSISTVVEGFGCTHFLGQHDTTNYHVSK